MFFKRRSGKKPKLSRIRVSPASSRSGALSTHPDTLAEASPIADFDSQVNQASNPSNWPEGTSTIDLLKDDAFGKAQDNRDKADNIISNAYSNLSSSYHSQPIHSLNGDSWQKKEALLGEETTQQNNSDDMKNDWGTNPPTNWSQSNGFKRSLRPGGLKHYALTVALILFLVPFLGITLLTASYLLSPFKTQQLMTSLPKPLALSLIPTLTAETGAGYLEINSDVTMNGSLTTNGNITTTGPVNGLTISSDADGITITDASNNRKVSITGNNVTLDQSLLTSSSPTLAGLNLTSTKDQLVLGPTGGITGTLTWTPTGTSKTITLPDATTTLVGLDTTDTLKNKTLNSSDGNTISGSYPDITGITSLGTVTTGTWNGSTVGTAYGGTGATTAVDARTNLGLAIGTDVQAYDANTTTLGNTTTGLGSTLVLSTSPTFATSATVPLIIGSTSANGTLTFEGNNTTGNTTTSPNLTFNVGDSGGTTAMTILNNGDVGIGTTAPAYTLDVNGSVHSQNISYLETFRSQELAGLSALSDGGSTKSGNLSLGSITSNTITSDSRWCRMPGISRLPNGNLVVIYSCGTSDSIYDWALYEKISTDQGTTWSTETTIYTPPASTDPTDGDITLLKNGTLLATWLNLTSTTVTRKMMKGTVSGNNITWDSPVTINDPISGLPTSSRDSPATYATSKIVELADGTLVWPVYGYVPSTTIESAYIQKSTDEGTTWGNLISIAPGTATDSYSETNIVQLQDGTLVAMIRDDGNQTTPNGYARSVSSDNGNTWSVPALVIPGSSGVGRPALAVLGSGALFMIGRSAASGPYAGENDYYTSWDNGASWSSAIWPESITLRNSTGGGSDEYDSVTLLSGGTVAAALSSRTTLNNTDGIFYAEFDDGYGLFPNGLAKVSQLGINTTTPTSTLSVQGTQSTATLGSELTTNGTFGTSLTGWTDSGSNWSQSSGTALHAAGATDTLSQNIAVTNGTTYQVSFTIAGRTVGSVSVSLGSNSLVNSGATTTFSSNSTYSRTLVAGGTSGAQALTFTPTSDFDGSIGSVSVKAVTLGSALAVENILNSDGTTGLEIRSGGSGLNNIFIGMNAGGSNTAGFNNSALGFDALNSNTTGYSNSAVGYQALKSNTTGYTNLALGVNALNSNTTGYSNSALGVNALNSNTTGYSNSAVGYQALKSNTTGYYNSAVGLNALFPLTTGDWNSALGNYAGFYISGGGSNQTSNESLYLGGYSSALADGDTNEIVIGYNAIGVGSNSVVLGNSSITTTVLQGNVGIGTTNPGYSLDVQGSTKVNSKLGYLTNGADYAEWFKNSDSSLEAADVVALDSAGNLIKASGIQDNKVIGVISTQAGYIGNNPFTSAEEEATSSGKYKLVALVGQVPVKIASDSASINVGDYLTTSSAPGYAQKATSDGLVIGKALEAWNPSDGKDKINMLIGVGSSTTSDLNQTPEDILLASGSASLASSAPSLNVVSDATISGQLTSYQAIIQDTFKSLGKTFLGDTIVAGNFSINGTMSISGNSLSTLGTLYLQNGPLAQTLDLFGGKVTVTQDGSLNLNQGDLTVAKGKIRGNDNIRGEVTLKAGQTQVRVNETWSDKPKVVELTPASNLRVWTDDLSTSGFTIKVDQAPAKDTTLYWMVMW